MIKEIFKFKKSKISTFEFRRNFIDDLKRIIFIKDFLGQELNLDLTNPKMVEFINSILGSFNTILLFNRMDFHPHKDVNSLFASDILGSSKEFYHKFETIFNHKFEIHSRDLELSGTHCDRTTIQFGKFDSIQDLKDILCHLDELDNTADIIIHTNLEIVPSHTQTINFYHR